MSGYAPLIQTNFTAPPPTQPAPIINSAPAPAVAPAPVAGATAPTLGGTIKTGLGNFGGKVGDALFGTSQKGLVQFKGSVGTEGSFGGNGTAMDWKSATPEMVSQAQKVQATNTGSEGLFGKILSPEGMVAMGQAYAGFKNMQRDDEKWELAKKNDAEDRQIRKERRSGRIGLGNALAG